VHAGQPLRPSGLIGGAMVRRTYPQRTLVEVLLPDADKLWDPVLREIDLVLDDEDLVDRVTAAFAGRDPLSARRGWPRTPLTLARLPPHARAQPPRGLELPLRRARGAWQSRVPGLLPDRRRARPRRQDPHPPGAPARRAGAHGAAGPPGRDRAAAPRGARPS